MTELKTLKDIGQDKNRKCCSVEEDYNNICEKCLKAEAVKDIKDLENDGFMSRFCQDNPVQAVRDYIKWKNNLTEEDLEK